MLLQQSSWEGNSENFFVKMCNANKLQAYGATEGSRRLPIVSIEARLEVELLLKKYIVSHSSPAMKPQPYSIILLTSKTCEKDMST